ncbi:putative efflux pump gsfJ [Colletotrichum liriopes]|uniref:Efflux pump gsfJ n=1 Tax=Colletotrichum liriopes TaxID=708192 RepID=A0AA37LSE7_9PEZI|nr:putative efflux pump gsfJ [Colletotrichum liriopes]
MGDTVTYPGPAQLSLTMFALFMGMSMANLDSTILATTIPKITEESCNQLGQGLQVLPSQVDYLFALIFELGIRHLALVLLNQPTHRGRDRHHHRRLLPQPVNAKSVDVPWREKVMQLDLSGCALVLCAVIGYFLALQWGGLERSWSDGVVIGTFVGFVVISAACVANDVWMGDRASIVPRILKKRRIPFNLLAGLFVLIYHLPLYIQSLRNDTPLQSGASNLPFLTGGIFSMVSGFALSATNQLIPFLAISAALSAVGSGLTYTFITNTLIDKWVGYQILAGASTGFLSQIAIMANTTTVDTMNMGTVSAMTLFLQLIGVCFSVSAAQSIFGNTAPDIFRFLILSVGPGRTFTPEQLPAVLEA